MGWEEVMQQAGENGRIRRKAWPVGHFMKADDTSVLIYSVNEENDRKIVALSAYSDTYEDDWEEL